MGWPHVCKSRKVYTIAHVTAMCRWLGIKIQKKSPVVRVDSNFSDVFLSTFKHCQLTLETNYYISHLYIECCASIYRNDSKGRGINGTLKQQRLCVKIMQLSIHTLNRITEPRGSREDFSTSDRCMCQGGRRPDRKPAIPPSSLTACLAFALPRPSAVLSRRSSEQFSSHKVAFLI